MVVEDRWVAAIVDANHVQGGSTFLLKPGLQSTDSRFLGELSGDNYRLLAVR